MLNYWQEYSTLNEKASPIIRIEYSQALDETGAAGAFAAFLLYEKRVSRKTFFLKKALLVEYTFP